MSSIELRAYAKINLSLDVKGLLPNGYHQIEMVMQQILLCDDVSIEWTCGSETSIKVKTNRYYLPTDNRNLAYKAAELMAKEYGEPAGMRGLIDIYIYKRIPVAAGLAGGSSNCAAVIHGLNKLWNLNLSLTKLCEIGSKLGSDVPFCIMGQAAANEILQKDFKGDPLACHCALATGTGTELKPLPALKSHLVLSKPPISVSTAEVYNGIDSVDIPEHPDTDKLIEGLEKHDLAFIEKNMINVLENFTLRSYPIIVYTKNKMQELRTRGVLMSGSGPTVYCLCTDIDESKRICRVMSKINKESFWTRTTW